MLQDNVQDRFEVYAKFDQPIYEGLTLSFFSTSDSDNNDRCNFGQEDTAGWKELINKKQIEVDVKCSKDGCESAKLLEGDMPDFEEYAGVEVKVNGKSSAVKTVKLEIL